MKKKIIKKKKAQIGASFEGDPNFPFSDQNPLFGTEQPGDGLLTQRMPVTKMEPYRGTNQYPSQQIKPIEGGGPPPAPKKKKDELSNQLAFGLQAINGLIPRGDMSRKYLHPEDQLTYNASPYGTNSQAIMKKGGKMKAEDGMLMPIDGGKKKRKKLKGGDQVYPTGYGKYSGINNGSEAPTEEEWILNMVEYMKNNNQETSNVYRPEYSHHSINYNPEMFEATVAKKGATIKMQDGGKKKKTASTAYSDSLYLYREDLKYNKEFENVKSQKEADLLDAKYSYLKDYGKKAGIKSIDNSYKKPMGQPVVYQKKPPLEKIPYSPNTIPMGQPIGGNGQIAPINTMREQNNYRVEYEQDGKATHKDFPSETSGNRFQKAMPGNRTGYYLKNGGKMSGGGLQIHSGGSAPQVSENPFDGGMGEFKGDSHANGGIQASFSGKPFEAEGGEPYRIASNGDLEIFGKLKKPFTNNTFKKEGKMLAKKEQEASKYTTLGTELVNNSPEQKDQFETLRFNSGQAMLRGGLREQKKLAQEKETLSMLQKIMLQEESPEKAEWGASYSNSFNQGRQKFKKNTFNMFGNQPYNPYENLNEELNSSLSMGNQSPYGAMDINTGRIGMMGPQGFSNNQLFKDGGQIPKYAKGKAPDPEIPIVDIAPPEYLEKFERTLEKTKAALQAKHPGKKIEVVYNELGGARSAKQQTVIKGSQKKPLSKDFSAHNWDAARDYNIYIDGALQGKTSKEYGTLRTIAQGEGLHFLKGNAGKEDPFHISLVEEGGPKTAENLLTAYPELAKNPAVQNWTKEIWSTKDKNLLPPAVKKAYEAATQKGISPSNYTNRDEPANLVVPKGMGVQGEGLYPNPSNTPPEQWTMAQKLKLNKYNPSTPAAPQQTPPFEFSPVTPQSTPMAEAQFPWEQALPLTPALFDQPDPVQMQQFTPDLYQDYEISLQDRRNRNTTQLRGIAKASGYDPSALGALGAQAYQANNEVDAEEFRINQGNFNAVNDKNISLLNNAELKNLELGDRQYERQTQAIGNTRDRRQNALIQLGELEAQSQLENKTENVLHNLYKDFAYSEKGELQYVGPSVEERMKGVPYGIPTQTTKSVQTTKTGNTTVQNTSEPIGLKKALTVQEHLASLKKNKKGFKNGGSLTQNKLAKLMNC